MASNHESGTMTAEITAESLGLWGFCCDSILPEMNAVHVAVEPAGQCPGTL